MAYWYEVYTPDKQIVQGTVDASSESMAEEILYGSGYQRILRLREIRSGLTLERVLPQVFGVNTQQLIDFSRELATLLESGMPILTSLQLLEDQAHNAAMRKVVFGLGDQLKGGSSLSHALGKYPQAFSATYRQMIKASELTGNLAVALRQVADYMEKDTATTDRIKRAMAYPTLVLSMAIGVFILITTVAMPPLVRLFSSLGAELPLATRLFIATSDFLTNYKFYLLGVIIAIVLSMVVFIKLPTGKMAIDKLVIRIPVISRINIQRNICRFCRTASMLLKTGLPLPQIMDISIGTTENKIIRNAFTEVRKKLIQGQGLSQPMAGIVLFPRLLVDMVAIGEKTGTLDSTLNTLSDLYEQRVEQGVRTLTAMIGPLLILAVGLIVCFIAISMISPLYSILRSMY